MNRSEPVWIGVDPGGRHTGVVAARGSELLEVLVIHRDDGEHVTSYAARVADDVDTIWGRVNLRAPGGVLSAIEDVVPINPHVGERPINPTALIDTAAVLGAVHVSIPRMVIIRPAGHGSHPLGCYPPGLVTAGERRKKGWEMRIGRSSDMRHARSAWDVIQAARLQTRAATGRGTPHSRSQPTDDRGAA